MFEIKLDLPKTGANFTELIRTAMLSPTRKAARHTKKYFDSTVETWTHRPTFEPKSTKVRGSGEVSITVAPEGGGYPERASGATLTAAEIWTMLNNGTEVRRVTLRKGFKPKTAPGRIKAQPGYNPGAFHQGRNFPGQVARNWTGQIAEIIVPQWHEWFQESLAKAFERGWTTRK